MNGPWSAQTIFGLHSFNCDLDITQSGTSLSITGTCGVIDSVALSGTINPATGSFSAAGTAGTECPSLVVTLASASLDNRTFFAGLICSGGPNGAFQEAVSGRRCGNGVVDAITAEECDIAIHPCCTFQCQFAPPGAFCGDGNQCTDDACDGSGTCVSTNRTGSCDDFNQCTGPDECQAGSCVGPVLPDDSPCDDFNDCTVERCQAGTCDVANLPDGTPCNDYQTCLTGETCLNGFCEFGEPVTCPPCQACFEPEGCVVFQYPGHAFYGPARDSLLLKKTQKDSARWKWTAFEALDPSDFGNPVTTTGYELCVFDMDPMTFQPILLLGVSLPAGGDWSQTKTGFLFKNLAAQTKVRLKAGAAGKAKLLAKAKGAAGLVQSLPPLSFVEVQLRTAVGAAQPRAFTSFYLNPVTSTEKIYKAEYPEP